jgi:hypothetical protein
MRTSAAVALILSTVVTAQDARPARPRADLEATLAQVSRQVESYYSRARAVLCTERVVLQPLGSDLTPDGFARRLVYELRVEWEPGQDTGGGAHIARRLLSINGRPPRPQDEQCTDPMLVSPEPLSIFLPSQQGDYAFSLAGAGRTDGRDAVLLDYQDASGKKPEVKWKDDCVSVDVTAKTRGRVWVDADTGDVLRLDERFAGLFDIPVPRSKQGAGVPTSMTIERNDTSIRYRQVTFTDPDDRLLLPSSVETLTIIRNGGGTPRLRTSRTFSDYRRFVTNSRIVQ